MKNNEMILNIMKLSQLIGISSREFRIVEFLKDQLDKTKYDISIDNLGNLLIGHNNNEDGREKVLIFAHVDEIGMIVRKIDDNGFIYFERLGGVNTQILPGTELILDGNKGMIKGVIGVQSHHFMPSENKFIIPAIKQLYIDIGVNSIKEVNELGIEIGTYIAFDANCEIINDKYIRGKSLDNRMAVGILLELAKYIDGKNLPYNLYFCFPVMEEFNIRGILPVIRKIKPNISLGIDITPSCDTPDLDYNDVSLGCGPAITCMNFHGGGTLAGVLPNKELYDMINDQANILNIHLQKEVAPGVITENAFAIFENDEGVKVANLSIPTRYTHTPFETAAISDINELLEVLKRVLENGLPSLIQKKGGK